MDTPAQHSPLHLLDLVQARSGVRQFEELLDRVPFATADLVRRPRGELDHRLLFVPTLEHAEAALVRSIVLD